MAQHIGWPGPGAHRAEAPEWKGTERFEVVRFLGRGGMGAVYEAIDRERGRRVAIKTVLRFDPTALYLFKQEFRTLAGVSHPNLVRLYELVASGDGEGVIFFSMELVRGVDFLRYLHGATNDAASGTQLSRRTTPADLERLTPAVRQLVDGVRALHAAGKLHRDIKPSNVLVTDEGRVVLLDFGVATDVGVPRDGGSGSGGDSGVVGTAAYMAPEQAFDESLSPAADWYSVGAMLYEALVGSPPFAGAAMEVIHAKNSTNAPAPSERIDGVPDHLDALCRALLSRDPAERPKGAEILRRLSTGRTSMRPPAPADRVIGANALIGRERHTQALDDAFGATRAGASVTVCLAGRVGTGKSALARHFLDSIAGDGEALVLRGRAYERESLPYKAVDTVIDALSRYLVETAEQDDALPLPSDIGALAHLFPVLRRVPTLTALPEERVTDPARTRRLGFGALRTLLGAMSKRTPLVLFIDDAQWGDTDSAALLLELLRPPNAPPLLLLLAYREEDRAAPFLSELRARWPTGAEMRDVVVGPLDVAGSKELAASFIGAGDHRDDLADAVARESQGNPFLIEELTGASASRMLAAGARVSIDELVADRLVALPAEARQLVEVVAVSGRPLPLATLGEAAGTGAIDDAVGLLVARRFVRSGLRDGREVAEPIHDRIRDTIVAQLAPVVVRERHAALARVLEANPSSDPESVAVHLLGAGESERASLFAEKAAERAAKLLAFDQAARLFRLAVDVSPSSSARLPELRARLGEVLGWAGRNEEAGRAYVAAAETCPAAARSKYERLAASQLLAAGRLEEGGLMLRRVLEGAGVKAPQSPVATMVSLMAYKARLRVLGLKFVARDASQLAPADGARMDAMHVAALGLASVDVHLAACMQARQLYEALHAGDRARTVRAATLYHGSHLATRGGPVTAHEREVMALIERLVEQGGSADERAFSLGRQGIGLFLRGHWRESVTAIDRALETLQAQQAQAGMRAQWALYAVYSQAFLGDLAELRRRQVKLLADAEDRGDLFMTVMLQISHPIALRLAADDPDGARTQIRAAKEKWSHGKFLIQDWQVMRSEVETELYAGDGDAAHERLRRDARALEKSLLLRVQFMRVLTAFARGRAAVAAALKAPSRSRALLAEAREAANALRREKMAWSDPLAALVSASVQSVEGNRAACVAALRQAIASADAANMTLYSASAKHQLGLVLGGPAEPDDALAIMRAQEIRAPSRFASMLVPGLWNQASPQ